VFKVCGVPIGGSSVDYTMQLCSQHIICDLDGALCAARGRISPTILTRLSLPGPKHLSIVSQ